MEKFLPKTILKEVLPLFLFFPHGSVKAVLKQFRKSNGFSTFILTLVVCFFVAAKLKPPVAPPTKQVAQVKPAPTPSVELAQLPTPVVPSLSKKAPKVQSKQKRYSKRNSWKKRAYLEAVNHYVKKIREEKLKEIAIQGLEESPLGGVFSVEPFESLTVLDPQFALNSSIPREAPLSIHEGVLVANDFEPIHQAMKELAELPELKEPVVAPSAPKAAEPVLVTEQTDLPSTEEVAVEQAQEKNPEPEVASETRVPTETVVQADSIPQPVVNPEPLTPPTLVTPPAQNLNPLLAAPVDIQSVITQQKEALKSIQQLVAPPPSAPKETNTQPQLHKNPNRSLIPGVEASRTQEIEQLGKVFGKLTFDRRVQNWIESGKGHVELHLRKERSQEPQDSLFIDYQYPSRDFSLDARELEGSYQLVASFFRPDSSVAVAEVTYPKVLDSQTAKEMIVFHVRKEQVEDAIRAVSTKTDRGVVLSGTVFEGGSGDHRDVKPLAGAAIQVVGQSDWGSVQSDKEGNFRIPYVSANSEYLLSVTAPGYYPTEVIVPTFQTTGYVSVHLIPKDKVEVVTRYFTKRPQVADKAVIMGRLFDPASRAPKADQEVVLSGRNGRALYFGALPDRSLRQTTATGLFGFFNVEPAFRSVGKPYGAASELINIKPGSAYYIEMGRGGTKTVRGTLVDPYRQQRLSGLVRVVGSPTQVETNEQGEFEIDAIELSPGIITLEVEAQGYPISWHTLSWSARESKKNHFLYLAESELLHEVRASVAKVSERPHSGVILGGAESRFFENSKSCVYVSLTDSEGLPVSPEQGPFPLHRGEFNPQKPLCLAKQSPGFSYFNLKPGQYILKWKNRKGEVLRSHVTRVGADRTSILIN